VQIVEYQLICDAGGALIVRSATMVDPYVGEIPLGFSSRGRPTSADTTAAVLGEIRARAHRPIGLGGNLVNSIGAQGNDSFALLAPFWALAILTAILPSVSIVRRFRRRHRLRDGLCTVCGYDLRATPQRCPECGTVPAATSSKTT
jgi:hypothetical protein